MTAAMTKKPDTCRPALLGLDLGTSCGWCLYRPDGLVQSGIWNLRGSRYEGGGMRYIRFVRFLDDVSQGLDLRLVAFEEVRRHLGVDAGHIYGGFVAHLSAWCEKRNIPYEGIPVGTVKKFATGNGNANKERMVEAARLRWPEAGISDDNEADARWITALAAERHMVV